MKYLNSSIALLGVIASMNFGVSLAGIIYSNDAIPDEWIVFTKDQTNPSSFSAQSAAALAAKAPGVKVLATYNSAIAGFYAKMSEKAAKHLAEDPSVDFVEQNARVYATQDVTWGLDRIDERDLPLDNSYTPSPDNEGENVVAYIIDTGIKTDHVEFGNRARWGTNTVDNADSDGNGHGTHVAGTVGGNVYGVAKKVELVAVKVLSASGSGTSAGVIQGVEWVRNDAATQAAAGKKATANMSLGGGSNPAMNAAVAALQDSGVVTVVAAGNSNTNACSASPASEPKVVTVGSTTSTDARSGFSNYGTCVDIFAPGSSITSAWINSNTATRTISGTSMASPHVCGGAALLLGAGNSPEQVTEMLVSRATSGKVTNPGNGSPNKLLYVGQVGPTPAPVPAPPTPPPTPCTGPTMKVEVLTDNYPAETGWKLDNLCTGNTVEQVQTGTYTEGNNQYVKEFCVPSAQYKFTITDNYGDGICCGYGSGEYKVTYGDQIVKEGGQFAGSEETTFGDCTTPSPTPSPIAAPSNCGSGLGPYSVKVDGETIIKGGDFDSEVPEECSVKMFTFNLNSDNYPTETTWQLKSLCGGSPTLTGGPYAHKKVDVETLLLDGKYEFTIFDSGNNGICCGLGQGSYNITYDGNTEKDGGEFGASDVTTFGECSSDAAQKPSYKKKALRGPSE